MPTWSDGYVSDIEYLPGFYMDQMPSHLNVACLLRDTEPPVAVGEPFRYCELGCGVGESALAIAASNHCSEVWGFDFNPAHIARGRDLAQAGGLRNIHLEDASFEQLVKGEACDPPAFDYIALHGVWSWISAENRSHIVRFIDRHLKPGGLVYVTYNALPGWTAMQPLQRLISTLAALDHERSDRRVSKAIDIVRRVCDAGAPALPAADIERLEKERDKGNLAYLSHEYLNEHWAPCYHSDVAGDLADAKLEFIGSANLLENFPDLSLKPEQRALIQDAPHAVRETLRDYFMVRTFRRDVFVRGPRIIPDRRRDQRLRQQKLMLVIPAAAVQRSIKIPLGEAMLSERSYEPAFRALAEGPQSIGELLDLADAAGSTASPREMIGMLIGSRQAMTVTNENTDEAVAIAKTYNTHHLADCADNGRAVTALAAPAVGSAVTVTIFEMLAYEAISSGTPADPKALTEATWKLLQDRGDRLRYEGEIVDNEDESLKILHDNMERIVDIALPLWRRLGAI
jgi:SAM-dependent methyltransferase